MQSVPLKIFRSLCLAACVVGALAFASSVDAASPAFDRMKIHAYYQNGDFEKVIRELDRAMKSARRCSRGDSLFAAKYLGVVYAANPDTRELGRYHMFRMLALDPNADLLDMFVGDEVGGVFEKVRKEFALRNASLAAAKAAPASPARQPAPTRVETRKPAPAPARVSAIRVAPPQPVSKPAPAQGNVEVTQAGGEPPASETPPATTSDEAVPEWKGPVAWIGGGAAVAVLGLALYFSHPPEGAAKTYVVPRTVSP